MNTYPALQRLSAGVSLEAAEAHRALAVIELADRTGWTIARCEDALLDAEYATLTEGATCQR